MGKVKWSCIQTTINIKKKNEGIISDQCTVSWQKAKSVSVPSNGVNQRKYTSDRSSDNLGDDVCRSGYRPLDRFEAEEHKNSLLPRMGTWDIVGLKTTG
ncbi:hypothetical protein OH492_09685 [Vibrio chagasii]|nr:hypothetical protein [Vibrio chagasii]